jgi:hypothetical protein
MPSRHPILPASRQGAAKVLGYALSPRALLYFPSPTGILVTCLYPDHGALPAMAEMIT